ncbi:hypothetical protein Bra3105_09920 [Brachybacterium halotolerans subsp. kimchii]|uniref:hypothetical protein n=1 Tax=Brachybacterium halotolerans TaxID=2795215 RepID=UPI001E60BA3C|nr:hypothetical protein [Brachybacterium halotolerans]UEJ81180.1 hypothetical protein Bra3105_09920 [Brachybacterium halotolerans subsp. kimchii]
MNVAALLLALAPYGAALLLTLLLVLELVHMLLGRRHPLRILDHVLSCGFFLLLAGLMVPIGGALTIVWWVFVALSLGAAILALARSRVAASKAVPTPPESLPARGTPAAAEARRNRRRLHRAMRPTTPEVAITVALFAGAATLWLVAG